MHVTAGMIPSPRMFAQRILQFGFRKPVHSGGGHHLFPATLFLKIMAIGTVEIYLGRIRGQFGYQSHMIRMDMGDKKIRFPEIHPKFF